MTNSIPSGITFGRKVLLVPAISYAFSHSGYVTGLKGQAGYTWVKRGEPIATYTLREPRIDLPFLRYLLGTIDRTITIPSPASGMLLHSLYDFGNDEHDFQREGEGGSSPPVRMAILLPDDEPPADAGRRMFSELCRVAWEHRTPFLKPSMYWSKEAMPEATLKQYVDTQLELKAHTVDALPHYEAYLQEARTLHTDLRPHLKHLQ